ncbi:hypothetical protein ACE1SV_36970 [Streptomyces sennicomposti]
MEKLVELGAKAELPGQALGQSFTVRRTGAEAPARRTAARTSMGRPPGKGAAPLTSWSALAGPVRPRAAYGRQSHLPLAASLSLLPAETFTL